MPIDKPTKSNHHSRVTKKNVEISTNEQLIFNISRNGIRFEFDLMIFWLIINISRQNEVKIFSKDSYPWTQGAWTRHLKWNQIGTDSFSTLTQKKIKQNNAKDALKNEEKASREYLIFHLLSY